MEKQFDEIVRSTYELMTKRTTIKKKILKVIKGLLFKKPNVDFFWGEAYFIRSLVEFNISKENKYNYIVNKYYDDMIKKLKNLRLIDQVTNSYGLLMMNSRENKYEKIIKHSIKTIDEQISQEDRLIPYRQDDKDLIYIDALGMICPFLAAYGAENNSKVHKDIAFHQIENYYRFGFDSKGKLPYQAYNKNTGNKLGLYGWGRSIGWLMYGMVDTIGYYDKESYEYLFLKEKLKHLISDVVKYIRIDGYFSWQVIDIEGHKDTSATSMILYAIKKSIELEIVDSNYESYCNKGLTALLKDTINGVNQYSSAECRGLGMHPFKFEQNIWGQAFLALFISKYI